MQNHR
eukprot:UN01335